MHRTACLAGAVLGVMLSSTPVLADYVFQQGTSAPAYSHYSLTFDEPGTPTGFVPADTWAASHGITELDAGDHNPAVDDWRSLYGPWVGEEHSFFGFYGVFMTLAYDVTDMSLQVWDPSGPPNPPFPGGMTIYLFDDGVEVASYTGTPAWSGIGEEWIDMVANEGDVFDEVRVVTYGYTPWTFVDNLSWNVVPEPSGLVVLLVLGASRGRRR
jgi:hypothetical protein